MAFWRNKSEDPWDIDPEKRQRVAGPVYETETEPEAESSGGFLSGLFKEEQAEETPPLSCPWCGKTMEKGYLICGRGLIQWTKVKPGAILGSLFTEAVTISDEGILNSYKTSHMCAACRKLVVDVPEQEDAWRAPTEPAADEADEAYQRYQEQLKDYQ